MDIELECPKSFEIRSPRWYLIAGIVILAITVVASICMGVYLSKLDDKAYVESMSYLFAVLCFVFLFMAVLLVISYFHDMFKYDDGQFTRKRVFLKTKTWNIVKVGRVDVHATRGGIMLVFWDTNNKRIAFVSDAVDIWKDGSLRKLLYIYNIPVKGNAVNLYD